MANAHAAWDAIFSFVPSLALKALVSLRIPDILAASSSPLTPQLIASRLPAASPNIDYLSRILRFLASCRILSVSSSVSDSGHAEELYGLTERARPFLAENNPRSFSGFLLFQLHEAFLAPWHHLHEAVLEGGEAFEKAHGQDMWALMREDPNIKNVFNRGMESVTVGVMGDIIEIYDGFKHVGTLIDVGGGTGQTLSEIVAAYPHIHGINFDLPHVIASAPSIPGVKHVEGDMFESIPPADAIFMKTVLHDWTDELCIQILRNCHKAIPQDGRIIIADMVLNPGNMHEPGEQHKLMLDLVMIAHPGKGRERTEEEWRALLSRAGFSIVKIYGPECLYSIIEAFKA